MAAKGRITLIKEYFGKVRPVELNELRALSDKDKQELAEMICKETGDTIAPNV